MRRVLFFLTVLVASAAHAADEVKTTNFTGSLVNPETGLPAAGVRVTLVEPGEYSTVTEAGGRFVFRDIPVATYRYMFAFERGDKPPIKSFLIGRNIPVEEKPAEAQAFQKRLLTERTGAARAKITKVNFLDRRERNSAKPIMLRDFFGVQWPTQYMSVPVMFERNKCRLASIRVADGMSGMEVPSQLSDIVYGTGDFVDSCTVTFPATLKPTEEKVYVVAYDEREGFVAQNYESDLKAERDKETGELTVSNAKIAIKLPPARGEAMAVSAAPAPILEIKGPDGIWFGKGQLTGSRKIGGYTCEETVTGPVYKQFVVTYLFPEEPGNPPVQQAMYRVTIRIYSQSDYVLVREEMGGQVDMAFKFTISEKFDPDTAMCAIDGQPAFPEVSALTKTSPTTLAFFRPWNPPGIRNSHNWYGFYSTANRNDAFGVLQVDGGQWQFAGRENWGSGAWLTQEADATEMKLVSVNGGLSLDMPFRPGARQFAITVFDKNINWSPKTLEYPPKDKQFEHHLNRMHMLLSQVSLNRLSGMKLDRASGDERPHLLFKMQNLPQVQAMFSAQPGAFPPVMQDFFTGSRVNTSLTRQQMMSSAAMLRQAFVGDQNEPALSGFSSPGTDPEFIEPVVRYLTLLYDVNSMNGILSEREREFVLGTLALTAHQLESPNYWAIYAHSPSKVAKRDNALTMISLLLNRHPESAQRLLNARSVIWSDLALNAATGGMPFDVGEFCSSLNQWIETAPCFANAASMTQVGSSPFEWPSLSSTLDNLVTLTAPPDMRFGGARLLPALGRTHEGNPETLAFMGLAAAGLNNKPDIAPRLGWAWQEAGQPFYAPDLPYHMLLGAVDRIGNPPVKAPEKAESVLLPGFGALMRTKFNQPDEAYLLFKCSPYRHSSHQDQASLIFYAFGQPLLIDSGTIPERQAAWAHNTVRVDSRCHIAGGDVLQFASQDDDDYVLGELSIDELSTLKEFTKDEIDAMPPGSLPPGHRADGSQTSDMLVERTKLDPKVKVKRQVLFNKQRQYLVVVDRVQGKPAEVFYNVCADDARVSGDHAEFAGPFGVDATIYAFSPSKLAMNVHKDLPQRWYLRVSAEQPSGSTSATAAAVNTEPASAAAQAITATTEPAAATTEPAGVIKSDPAKRVSTEIMTVVCPSKRDASAPIAAPKVEKLEGVTGVKLSYGNTTRYIFLSDAPVKYKNNVIEFEGTRGMLTVRPTHVDIALFDAGKMTYNGRGIVTNAGMVRIRLLPNSFVEGELSGNEDRKLTFLNPGLPASGLIFKTDNQQFIADGDELSITYGVGFGKHTITIEPK